ncbi:transcriptional regulator, LacI family [Kandleria vitulina]|jgi:DNA-binding LacI/PurR family transcriptional regulator|uniref:LacI family DNA-binding transcriptional regulator n=1 Tax=Kandleria vitulina TaxID=1630 RepID=UPI00088A2DE7|nr:LacI family DNA-binding transcriptional regulator [Kandleria vitulina]SDL90299.1 transcriptional regulator, LacI family [Kandleria vitulina]
MGVTIKDIAKKAGVSTSTVSRVINDHYSISDETKKRVRDIMNELGYHHEHARTIHTIGVVFPRSMVDAYENPFYLGIVRGISYICNKYSYRLNVITGANFHELKNSMEITQADGYIFLYSDIENSLLEYMNTNNLLYLIVGKPTSNTNSTLSVDTDNVQAGYEATKYLIALGHTKIGYLGTSKKKQFSVDRKVGYLQGITEAGLGIKTQYMVDLSSSYSYNPTQILELLTQEDRPTAFVVCDDIYATIIIRLIEEIGLKVPDDISIVSFNNSIFARLMHPALTSLDINANQLGMEAVSQLIKHIETPGMFATRTIVPFTITKRDSCKDLTKL